MPSLRSHPEGENYFFHERENYIPRCRALAIPPHRRPGYENPIILAEISPRFERAADLEAALAALPLVREALPWDAAFLAGQAFRIYRLTKGLKTSPMPDFYIGAHALVSQRRLLTRDAARYRTYFPKLEIVAP